MHNVVKRLIGHFIASFVYSFDRLFVRCMFVYAEHHFMAMACLCHTFIVLLHVTHYSLAGSGCYMLPNEGELVIDTHHAKLNKIGAS